MRVAVFRDYLDSLGGAEKVALTMVRRFRADLFTTRVAPDVLRRLDALDAPVHDLGPVPSVPPLKQIHASLRFRRARVPGYDVYIFVGDWSHYAGIRHEPGLFYCLTPVRMFYDQRGAILRRLPRWQRPLFRAWTGLHARWDRRAAAHVGTILAISENVRRRIRRHYGRESRVVYPPVATSRFRFREVGDFWLSTNRLYPEKRLDLQFEIFRRLPQERLVVVGGGAPGDLNELNRARLDPPPNVELLGEVSERELGDLYGRCRGFLATAVDEDFGLTPVEAMAAGKAVLATNEGGYLETVVEGKTGWLLPPEASAFAQKVKSLSAEDLEAMRRLCEERARAFDEERFVQHMGTILEAIVSRPA